MSFFKIAHLIAALAGIALAHSLLAAPSASASSASPSTSGAALKYLSGTGPGDAVQWDFFCTAGRRGGEWTKIRVPSCWEQEGFGTYYYGNWHRNGGKPAPEIPSELGKYRTTFNVPADWKGQNVRIVFAGVMTDAEVLVNGKSAGPVHQGGFYQFEYDISALLNYGGDGDGSGAQNTLEVNVSKESANASVNNAERRGDYWTFGGIYRPVWLEARPTFRIERVAIDARADGSFAAEVFRNGNRKLSTPISVKIFDAQNKLVGEISPTEFDLGQPSTIFRTKISNPLTWTAETPNLYRAEFHYTCDLANVSYTYTQRFGFRTIEVRPGDGVYLNGQKIVFKGVDRHSFRPETGRTLSREDCYYDVRLIKEMNMNAVRMSHYPPDSAFLDACDELGLYVLDELAGWHGSYDTPTGARLIGEMVRRDVNHPSIVFWDNGNEGGWNTDNDGEFAKWDPQHRNVLHPWALHDNINTKHYPKYDQLQKLCAGNEIYFPTEFLHGLYDGGIGAGLADYWRVMSASPVCAGGFFWALVDEGVMRTDEFNRIDNSGNLAPDGIVGPHHEREGSFYTVKEIWSPVTLVSGPDADGNVEIQNNYDFTNLKECRFELDVIGEDITRSHVNSIEPPDIAPRAKGALHLGKLPDDHVARLRAWDSKGNEIWTWSWFTPVHVGASLATPAPAKANAKTKTGVASEAPTKPSMPLLLSEGPQIAVHRGDLQLRFDKNTGLLLDARVLGRQLPITAGPTLTAYARDNRRYTNLLPSANDAANVNNGVVRAKVTATTAPDGSVIIEAVYPDTAGNAAQAAKPAREGGLSSPSDGLERPPSSSQVPPGSLSKITWTIPPANADAANADAGADAGIRLDYEYTFNGAADLLGVQFDIPEKEVWAKSWFGRGPWRVYRNRLAGGVLGKYDEHYNDPIPGQTYLEDQPEFKGYFRDWRWLTLSTSGGFITFENNAPPNAGPVNNGAPYLGLWRPRDGVPMMMEFPDTSLTLLDVIPAQGSKFDNGDGMGPQTATPKVSGKRTGSVTLYFGE